MNPSIIGKIIIKEMAASSNDGLKTVEIIERIYAAAEDL